MSTDTDTASADINSPFNACMFREHCRTIASERDTLRAALEAERERCAKLCDELQWEMVERGTASPYGDAFARAIRATTPKDHP